jgi:ABC-type oligopeptide transport system substrate-binding subunit
MSGLTAPDAHTVRIVLSSPCGWCLAAWSLPASIGSIVDERVILRDPMDWWSKPGGPFATDGQVGTGAFYLVRYVPTQSILFRRVEHWWGSPKPALTTVAIDIKTPAPDDQGGTSHLVVAWERARYDLLGYGGLDTLAPDDLARITKSGSERHQVVRAPKGRTTWVDFNIGDRSQGGPFVGESESARALRLAFALAIDKKALAAAVCDGVRCTPATGGIVSKGLLGYGGDGSDPLGRFDPSAARDLLHHFDPSGTMTAGLKCGYYIDDEPATGLNQRVAAFLQAGWRKNLKLEVQLDPLPDASAFVADRLDVHDAMFINSRQLTYNHPQDWYDNLWGSTAPAVTDHLRGSFNIPGQGGVGRYAQPPGDPNSAYDRTLAQADSEPVALALPLYSQLQQMAQQAAAYIPLYYSLGEYLVHPYVRGAGSNGQFDFYWDTISILPP